MPPRPSTRTIVIVAVIAAIVVIALIATLGIVITQGVLRMTAQPPAVGTVVIAPEQSKALQALDHVEMDADEAAATQYLGAQPTAYWLTPELSCSVPTDS